MTDAKTIYDSVHRRNLLVAGGTLLAAATLPRAIARAADEALGSAAELLARVQKFLAGLDPDMRKAASFAWNGPEWRGWNYFGASGYTKPGLRLEQMSAAQKAAAWDLLAAVWSPAGIDKAKNVMLLQDVLASMGNAPDRRSSGKFSFAVFGAPAAQGVWGFRLEGHHLTQSVAVRDGRIVSVTPSSFSSNPNRVPAGAHRGLVTLKSEEALARRLYSDLAPALAAKARVSEQPIYNILSAAGRERANAQKVGVPAASLPSAQRDLLWQLVEAYSVEHLPTALSAAQRARVRAGDREAVHFAWHGPNTAEKGFGYRVIGDNFVIEMASVDAEAQHLHTIYNDLGNVLGTAG
ncbi:MAG: DUF3500 domain-containing protein [Xanthobacteraceae bacterium]